MRFFIFKALILIFFLNPTYAQSHHPQDFLQRISGTKDEGKQIYQHYCANCHALNPLIPLGAPRIGVLADWQPRLKKGVEALIHNTAEGVNAMPARGGCFECSDNQLELAIIFLMPKSLKNDAFNDLKDQKKGTKIKKDI